MNFDSYKQPYAASPSPRSQREKELTEYYQGRAIDAYREALRAIPKLVQEELDREEQGHLYQEYLAKLLELAAKATPKSTTPYYLVWPVPPYGDRSDVLFLLHAIPTPSGYRHVMSYSAALAVGTSHAATICLTSEGRLLYWSNHHQSEHWTNQPLAIEPYCRNCAERVPLETLEALTRVLSK